MRSKQDYEQLLIPLKGGRTKRIPKRPRKSFLAWKNDARLGSRKEGRRRLLGEPASSLLSHLVASVFCAPLPIAESIVRAAPSLCRREPSFLSWQR